MLIDLLNAPRCGARTKSRGGKPCQSPAMPNGRCYMHGGPSPGAPRGNQNALKNGHYTAEAKAQRREISALLRAARDVLGDGNKLNGRMGGLLRQSTESQE